MILHPHLGMAIVIDSLYDEEEVYTAFYCHGKRIGHGTRLAVLLLPHQYHAQQLQQVLLHQRQQLWQILHNVLQVGRTQVSNTNALPSLCMIGSGE